MANTVIDNNDKQYVVIDSTPPVGGFWTNIVAQRRSGLYKSNILKMFFSVREYEDSPAVGSVITPILQFKCEGDNGWTDYNNNGTAFVVGDRLLIDSNAAGVKWRAGVKEGGYTSGSMILGFDW